MAHALAHAAVDHPYLRALADGTLPDGRGALADFLSTYRHYSAWFPRYLHAMSRSLEVPAHRALVEENLAEESGCYGPEELAQLEALGVMPAWVVGVPHPRLFDRCCAALHVEPCGDIPAAARAMREGLLGFLRGASAAEAVGAMGLGTEGIVSTIYRPFVAALDRLRLEPRDTVFFVLHTAVDDHHFDSLMHISGEIARQPGGLQGLERGMLVALELRVALWDWLLARALAMAPACP